jgi:hypothetical protein
MGSLNGVANLHDNARDFLARKWRIALCVPLEDLASGPFDCKEMQARAGLAGLDRSNDIRVLHSCPELRFAKETSNGCAILAKLLAQHLQRNDTMLRMVSTIHGGGSTLPHHVLDAVPSKCGTYKRIA